MRRLILCGLLLLISSVTAPAVRAKTMAVNLIGVNSTETSRSQLTPFNLVGMAYQGYFKDQGIPGYQALISAYQFKKVNTRLLVKAAVSTGMVSQSTLTNRKYLSAVRADLRSMVRDDRGRWIGTLHSAVESRDGSVKARTLNNSVAGVEVAKLFTEYGHFDNHLDAAVLNEANDLEKILSE